MQGKKNKKENSHPIAIPAKTAQAASVQKTDFVPGLIILLYTLVEFIPSGGSGEVMGSQWLYLSVINIIGLLFLLTSKAALKDIIPAYFKNIAASSYFIFLLIAGASIFFAVNKIESLVTYARLITTAAMIINLTLLFHKRFHLFRFFTLLLTIYALIQSVNVLITFFEQQTAIDLNKLILSLTGNAGNKNILAVSLVLKIPFIIFCICTFNTVGRFLISTVLAIVAFTVFIINARSSYIGLLLAILIFGVLIFFTHYYYTKKLKAYLTVLAFVVMPVIAALFLSQSTIKRIIAEQGITTGYGSVIDRLNTISFTTEGSNSRVLMWSSAADYIKKNPVTGCGLGNWKLASVPYEKTYVDEIRIAKHTHNDFLEITAELGVAGGLFYILTFALLAWFLLKRAFRKQETSQPAFTVICLMALAVYFVDAFLNFPMERPVTQFFFAVIFSFALVVCFSDKIRTVSPARAGTTGYRILFAVLLLLSISSSWINYSVFKSLKAQVKVNDDIQSANPATRWQDIKDVFPSVPNLNSYGFPISHIKAFYLMIDKKYDSALALLNSNADVNPHLTLTEYLKSKIFSATNNPDSAFIYARKAFYAKPRALSHYALLNDLCLQRKDSAGIDSAFREFIKYRNEAQAWNRYIELKTTMQANDPFIIKLVDSALVLFPNDPQLLQKKSSLQSGNPAVIIPGSAEDAYQKNFSAGFELFAQKKYNEAIVYFTKASALKPGDYLAMENTGLCYYSAGDYQKAIPYFDRVLQSYSPTDGKAEFLKAISLLNLGNQSEGCLFLQKSVAKGFPQAAEQAGKYCK